MAQLALFEGSHLPRTAAREALARGDLHQARTQLERLGGAAEELADSTRLERIAAALDAADGDPVAAVHRAFVSALGAGPRGFLSDVEWFRFYAQCVAGALDAAPGRRFRGWLGAAFAFVAAEPDAARRALGRIIEVVPPGSEWIEAARLGFALGEATKPREWIHAACLGSPAEVVAGPPALEPCGVPALDAAPSLPPLPAPVEEVFEAARALEGLPGPWTRWVAVVGEIDRVLAPPGPEDAAPPEGPEPDADAARAFLGALRAARGSRERDRPRSRGGCSDRELRARRRMQRLAPDLLARYLQGLGGVLF